MIRVFGYELTIFQIAATSLGIGLLVFIHELGHFLMAKFYGIKVEQFTFGFGPELIGFTYGETRYSICAIPLGGMVKMPGEDVESAQGSPDEFLSQAWYKRLTLAFMGPFMNYLLATILFATVLFYWGLSKPTELPIIGETKIGYPAQKAGLVAGDIVKTIDGSVVKTWVAMADLVHKNPEKMLAFEIEREGKLLKFMITPVKDPAYNIGLVGVSPKLLLEKVGAGKSLVYGAKMTIFQSVFTLKYLGEKIVKWEKPELSGPLGVIQILAKAAKTGWENLLYLLAVISTALGLFNLLPIPMLDGGHIFIALIQAVVRKPLNKKAILMANYVGFSIIIVIFLFATYSDIARTFFTVKTTLP